MTGCGANDSIGSIAIVGMSGRFPGARNLEQLWCNLRNGIESVSIFSDKELAASDVDPILMRDPRYVRAAAVLDDIELFDAEFFGLSPREAQATDPQHRFFLECAHEALENAGYGGERCDGPVGVFASSNLSQYLMVNLYPHLGLGGFVGDFQTLIGNDKDYLATQVSYKLNLKGPSLSIQTACSSSLVAVCTACQSLLNYQCDMALAGGVTIRVPQKIGYLHQDGAILSPDGHCRVFDANAQGTVPGSGLGIVVLKRLEDAVQAGDCIHAVIRGWAVNNDGSDKVGYTAPSVTGQAKVIALAQALAGVKAETITYVETHGTGTTLGDPIEVAALARVFGTDTAAKHSCALGSIKSNFGHLEAAAGIASLIKTILALKHKQIPPSLHFKIPNREIDFENSPFYVNTVLSDWNPQGLPRLAGVSSFGIGGTNAHAVLEEAPARERVAAQRERPVHLLALSARTEEALRELARQYARHLAAERTESLADIAFTANTGRSHFEHRLAVIAQTCEEAAVKLAAVGRGDGRSGVFLGRVRSGSERQPPLRFPESGVPAHSLERSAWEAMLERVAHQYVEGAEVDWLGFDREYPRYRVALPTYPFERKRHWIDRTRSEKQHPPLPLRGAKPDRPLLGRRIPSPLREIQFQLDVSPNSPPLLADHRLHGVTLFPAAGYLEMVHAGAVETFGHGRFTFEEIAIRRPLVLPEEEVRALQLILTPESDRSASFQISSLSEGKADAVWTLHASGKVQSESSEPASPAVDRRQLEARCREVDSEWFYRSLAQRGLETGPGFRWIERIWLGADEAIAQLRPAMDGEDANHYQMHPGIRDACFQLIAAASGKRKTGSAFYAPVGMEQVRHHARPQGVVWGHATVKTNEGTHGDEDEDILIGDAQLFDETGQVWLEVIGLRARPAPLEVFAQEKSARISDWLYEVQWPRKGTMTAHQPGDYLPAVGRIAEDLRPRLRELSSTHRLELYKDLAPQLDALGLAYTIQAFRQLGWDQFPENLGLSTASVAERLRVQPSYGRLLARMLEMLEEEGHVRRTGSEWIVVRQPLATSPEEQWHALSERYPSFSSELDLLRQCGRSMAAVLRGERTALEVLFPGGSLAALEKLYRETPASQVCNTLVQEAISKALAHLPQGRTARVLEIGAGTGGTTSAVLPSLRADATEYVFTDISLLFTTKAEEKFRDHRCVQYRVLDIERDPTTQGFQEHQFDLILAAHVLHATSDLRRTIRHIQQLLAPGGMLLLLEATGPQRWLDLIFGLTEGWWKFEDTDLRPSHPLLSQDKWIRLLEASGFAEAAAIPRVGDVEDGLPQPALILAQSQANRRESTMTSAGPSAEGRHEDWLILADAGGVGEGLRDALRLRGERCVLAYVGDRYEASDLGRWRINPAQPGDFVRLFDELRLTGRWPYREVIHLWSLDSQPAERMTAESLEAAQTLGCESALHLIQGLLKGADATSPRVWFVTRGAQQVEEHARPLEVAQAPLWGLGRVVALEHPSLRCSCLDLDPSRPADELERLVEGLLSADEEDQIAFRGGARHVARLVTHNRRVLALEGRPAVPHNAEFCLEIRNRGLLDTLTLVPRAKVPPAAGEVQIQVRATGLNFKDVLNALAMFPEDGQGLGLECTGTIVALGEGVQGFEIGDEVIALASDSFSSFVTTPAVLVARKPKALSFEEAATIPVVFLTAYYALHHLAGIKPHDKVLIHAAAGGVGLAAVQLALAAGAEIFATAGSAEKREFLRTQGVPHVMNSRTLDFAGEVMARTAGGGVDIVLNSLSGEFIPKSLSVLAEQGRFLEIGKTDVWNERKVADFRSDILYSTIAFDRIMAENPSWVGNLFRELMDKFEKGTLKPLPHRSFPISEAPSAFRYMAQARHIGKIVVTQEDERNVAPPVGSVSFHPDRAYLITGGFGGLGLLVARWLVEHGVRHLALVGRSGASAGSAETLRSLEEAGAEIQIFQADVSREEDVAKVIETIGRSMPPLAGVIHAAGTLEDGILVNQDWGRFAQVMAPKVAGAWNLHSRTRDLPLDFFVLFSSIASLIGSPGQSNHAAANAFLDALAHYRRAKGLAASSINWGGWAEVGAAAARNVGERAALTGLGTIMPHQGLDALGQILHLNPAQIGVMPVDWQMFLREAPALQVPPLLSEILRQAGQQASRALPSVEQAELLRKLMEAPSRERRSLLIAGIQDLAAKILGLGQVPALRQPLNELGLDSLMAIELRNALEAAVGRRLPATLLFDYPTIEALADHLRRELFPEELSTPIVTKPQETDQAWAEASARLDEISEHELAVLLEQKIAALDLTN